MQHNRRYQRWCYNRHLCIIFLAVLTAAAIGIVIHFAVQSRTPQHASPGGVSTSQSSSAKDGKNSSSTLANSKMPSDSSSIIPAYQSSYPNLYVPHVNKIPSESDDKVVYLTFDDGPSNLTIPLLNVLDQYKVKATFFVMAQGKTKEHCAAWMKEIVSHGHAIALHTYTHDYHQIYASPQAFLDDFARMSAFIEESTGQKITMFRFPGGSVNDYDKNTYRDIIAEMTRRGYTYYDWNVSSQDAEHNTSRAAIYRNTIRGVHANGRSIVLMHNTSSKSDTLSQIGNIITTLKKDGYRFAKLDPSVPPINFVIPKA